MKQKLFLVGKKGSIEKGSFIISNKLKSYKIGFQFDVHDGYTEISDLKYDHYVGSRYDNLLFWIK